MSRANKIQLSWDTKELGAKARPRGPQAVEEGYDFLEAHMLGVKAPRDVFDGILEIDLDLADAKHIDNGATVVAPITIKWKQCAN